jgi:hypothetical protein
LCHPTQHDEYEESVVHNVYIFVSTSQEIYVSAIETMKKKKKREREVGSSERHYWWGEQNISSVLKVPRHCQFVLLVSVSF